MIIKGESCRLRLSRFSTEQKRGSNRLVTIPSSRISAGKINVVRLDARTRVSAVGTGLSAVPGDVNCQSPRQSLRRREILLLVPSSRRGSPPRLLHTEE